MKIIYECEMNRFINWTSVNDNLPNSRVGKLVYCDDKVTRMYYDVGHDRWIDQCGNEHTNVTHWMELPSPPSGLDG